MHSRLLITSFTTLLLLFAPIFIKQTHSSSSCADISLIFARGSGQDSLDEEEQLFLQELKSKSPSLSIENISLNYPAVSIAGFDKSLEQIRNGASAEFEYAEDSFGGDYRNSVQAGEDEATRQIEDIANQCYEEGTKIVLGGYSQGAHVIGNTLFRLSPAAREMIVYVGMFGDPKFRPNSYAVRGNFANSDGGILEARISDFPDEFRGKIESWCLNGDGICEDNVAMAVVGNHGQYPDRAIPAAASKAFINYKRSELGIAFSVHDSMPEPDSLGTNEVLSLQQSSKDIVLLADASPSTRRRWYFASKVLGKFFSEQITDNNHIGLTLYQSPKRDYATKQVVELTDGSVRKAFSKLAGSDGSLNENDPMDMVEGIESALRYQPWRPATEKKLLIVTDSPPYPNDTSLNEIADLAISNNMQINIIVKNNLLLDKSVLNQYENLAQATGGQYRVIGGNYHRFGGRILNVMLDSFTTPVVKPEGSYEGFTGEPLRMRVSASYDLDNHILFYEWDLDGDGSYEELTYRPGVIHTYTKPGKQQVHVRANAADGGVGYGSFSVEILPEEATPQYPAAESTSLQATEDGTYRLSWQNPKGSKPIGYSIYKEDDSLIGVVPGDQNEVVIDSNEPIDDLIIETNYPEGSSERVRIPFELEDEDNKESDDLDEDESSPDSNDNGEEESSEEKEDNTGGEEDWDESDNQDNTEEPTKDTDESDEESVDDESKDSMDENEDQGNDQNSTDDTQADEDQENSTDTRDSLNNSNNSSNDSSVEDSASGPEDVDDVAVVDEFNPENTSTASMSESDDGLEGITGGKEAQTGDVLGANDKAEGDDASGSYSRVFPMILIILTALVLTSVYRQRKKE